MVPQEHRPNQDVWVFRITAPIICFATLIILGGCADTQPHLANSATATEKQTAIAEMYAEYKEDFPDVLEMTAEEVAIKIATENVIIVDVREPEERAVSVIQGSISKKEFEDNLEMYDGQTIVVHCTIGYRSGVYVEKLQDKGIKAFNLPGSILSWVHAGQPVVDSQGNETKTVHVYGPKWDLLPEGYEAVW